jgi:hypothetical protein
MLCVFRAHETAKALRALASRLRAMIRRAVPTSPKMVVRYVKATSGIVFRAKPTGISEPNQARYVQNRCRIQLSRSRSICDKGSLRVRRTENIIGQDRLCSRVATHRHTSSIATLASAAAILEEPRRPRAGRLAFGQLDLSPRALRFRLLGNRHFQNALLELCLGMSASIPCGSAMVRSK